MIDKATARSGRRVGRQRGDAPLLQRPVKEAARHRLLDALQTRTEV